MPCKKHRYPKFEVCFQRSMNAMKDGVDELTRDNPQLKQVGDKLKKLKLDKLKKWEKELGSYAHQDVKNHW